MRKPVPDAASQLPHSHAEQPTALADGAPHAHHGLAAHAHDASMSAGAYSGVVAGEIGAEATPHGDGSVMMAAPSPSSSLQQLTEQREERAKKSVAYRHTSLHRLVLDNFGKEYEKRICSYCTAVFSFKGGTTSAALRHLKTAHSERLMYSGMSMPAPQQQLQLQQQLQEQQLQEQQQHEQQQEQQQYGGGGDEEVVAQGEATSHGAEIAQDQDSVEESIEQQETESDPDQTSPQDAEHAFNSSDAGVSSSGGGGAPQYADPPAVALHESGPHEEVVLLADGNTEQDDDADAKEDEGDVLSQEMQMRPPKVRQQAKRKRQRDDAESGRSGGDHGYVGAGAGGKCYPPPLTASQSAITHFLQHYKEMLSLPNRLRFVKHLTHHPSEAEMYNVLDEATQMEYVREFSDNTTTI